VSNVQLDKRTAIFGYQEGGRNVLIVRIELLPNGNERKRRVLGTLQIANDLTGTLERGNYEFLAAGAGVKRQAGRVDGFERADGFWSLVQRTITEATRGTCVACLGAGQFCISAGDGTWWDDCGECGGTGDKA
jgi:DnaJ-class molecular chaperone